jgi:uncharacterized membrane protein (UPF0182 family)
MDPYIASLVFVYGLVTFAIGYFFPFRMRKFKTKKKVTNSDAEYYIVNINSTDYAFTFEQLDVAEKRAKKLHIKVI